MLESAGSLFVFDNQPGQQFECDLAAQTFIVREVDFTHAPVA